MMLKNRLILLIFSALLVISSCSKYDKLVKSTDLDKKYEAAMKYYEKGNYVKAITLLEELVSVYRGTAKAETILFYYAYTNYNLGDYILASYHFKNFVKTYPNSGHAEECAYMAAYCYYLNSPPYSLDQTDTRAAMREFQSFVNQYPKSLRLSGANEIIDKLRAKLEKKSYEIAKLYYHIGDYKASIYAFKNVLNDFPDTKYREELSYLIIKSSYLFAINSIDSKKEERLKSTIEAYHNFVDNFAQSSYAKDAESIYESAVKMKEKIKTKAS
jgi:outer membrane protein assembly factor BamD